MSQNRSCMLSPMVQDQWKDTWVHTKQLPEHTPGNRMVVLGTQLKDTIDTLSMQTTWEVLPMPVTPNSVFDPMDRHHDWPLRTCETPSAMQPIRWNSTQPMRRKPTHQETTWMPPCTLLLLDNRLASIDHPQHPFHLSTRRKKKPSSTNTPPSSWCKSESSVLKSQRLNFSLIPFQFLPLETSGSVPSP